MREAATSADRMVTKAQRDAEAMLEESRAEIAALWDDVRPRRQQSEEATRGRSPEGARTQARQAGTPAAAPSAPTRRHATDAAARLIDEAFGDARRPAPELTVS